MAREFLFPIQLVAEHLDDAWHQAIRTCFQFGYEYVVEHGSYQGQKRFELDFASILIKRPWEQIVPILPEAVTIPPPASREQIETYLADYLYSDTLSPREDYRYGERLVAPKFRKIERPDLQARHVEVDPPKEMGVNQVREVIRIYKEGGTGTNQCTMEIAMPNDILLQDPPCARLIDTRVRYGRLHFIIYFRSWDLYAGFPVNLGGMELLKEMMAGEIGVENGSMVVASKGLHIYEQYYELVECQTQMSIDQLRAEGEEKRAKLLI
ncbi:MAG: thymidylate synthase [Planctomycetota bacterium]